MTGTSVVYDCEHHTGDWPQYPTIYSASPSDAPCCCSWWTRCLDYRLAPSLDNQTNVCRPNILTTWTCVRNFCSICVLPPRRSFLCWYWSGCDCSGRDSCPSCLRPTCPTRRSRSWWWHWCRDVITLLWPGCQCGVTHWTDGVGQCDCQCFPPPGLAATGKQLIVMREQGRLGGTLPPHCHPCSLMRHCLSNIVILQN